jgi:acetylornithine deacetylase/succinyl-diaminopimelate desuccinylase-like protein
MPAAAVRSLATSLDPVFRRIRDADAALIDDQIAIARVPAPTGAEAARAEWMAERLGAAGLRDVRIDDAGNVVALSPGKGSSPVVLCAHLDTVFDSREPVRVRHDGVRLHAPGISDNARGLATMAALADLVGSGRLPLRRSVIFAATTCEEGHGDLRGCRHLFDTVAANAFAAVALDGPGDERIVNAALGCRRYHVAFRGPGGHSWGRYGSPNAIHAAAALVTRLTGYAAYDRTRTALTVSRIAGARRSTPFPPRPGSRSTYARPATRNCRGSTSTSVGPRATRSMKRTLGAPATRRPSRLRSRSPVSGQPARSHQAMTW